MFLPAEHDPDSFIRAFGREAFARHISDAVPLSRFLIDSARDGFDLNTAEGRAQLAGRAKPLWMQLPDGALKRQLLGEIADLVQLAARELTELWTPKTASGKSGKAKSYSIDSNNVNEFKGYKPFSPLKSSQPPRWGGRALPASRADHAVRLLMGNMAGLAALTAEEHAMLCELPAPHGALFVWLEGQLQEHGNQPWVALREGLRGHGLEELGIRLMGDHELDAQQLAQESSHELRQLLDRMLVERLKAQETEAIEAARLDPNALVRYREIQARRRQLELAGERADTTAQMP